MRRPMFDAFWKTAFLAAMLGMTGCSSSVVGGNSFASIFDGAPDAHGLSAQAADAMQKGDAASAETLYTQAIDTHKLTPLDNANTLLNRGLAREKLGKDQDALADFTAALALNALVPADAARAQFDRGVALDELGRMPEAIGAFSEALRLQPNFAAAYNNRGNAHLRLGDLVTAKSDYQAALANGIASPEYVWYGLGQIAQAQGDFAGARDCYGKALGVNPGYSLATARLADLEKLGMPRPLAPAASPSRPQIVARAQTRRSALTDASYESTELSLRPSIDGGAAQPGAAQIQLGAYRDEATATQTWKELVAKTGGLLAGLSPSIVSVDLPDRGRFWRLRAGVSDGHAAASLCGQLKSKGFDCFQVRG